MTESKKFSLFLRIDFGAKIDFESGWQRETKLTSQFRVNTRLNGQH